MQHTPTFYRIDVVNGAFSVVVDIPDVTVDTEIFIDAFDGLTDVDSTVAAATIVGTAKAPKLPPTPIPTPDPEPEPIPEPIPEPLILPPVYKDKIVSPLVPADNRRLKIIFPETTYVMPTWLGASTIFAEWTLDLKCDNNWISFASLRRWMSSYYVLAVRTRGQRLRFWANVGEKLECQIYNGEPIWHNAVFELWTTTSTPQSYQFPEIIVPINYFRRASWTFEADMSITLNIGLFSLFCNDPIFDTGSPAICQFCLPYPEPEAETEEHHGKILETSY
jgi:hypothetical protein